jgi:hypothetical protein
MELPFQGMMFQPTFLRGVKAYLLSPFHPFYRLPIRRLTTTLTSSFPLAEHLISATRDATTASGKRAFTFEDVEKLALEIITVRHLLSFFLTTLTELPIDIQENKEADWPPLSAMADRTGFYVCHLPSSLLLPVRRPIV